MREGNKGDGAPAAVPRGLEFLEQGETSAPSHASLLVDPEVGEDVSPV